MKNKVGHIRLGTLPSTRKWKEVVRLLEGGAGTPEVAAATFDASQQGLKDATHDAGLNHTFWLLTQIVGAAQSDNFKKSLNEVGLDVGDKATFFNVLGSFASAVDAHMGKEGKRSDLGEMAQLAASEAMSHMVGQEARSLFGTTEADVQKAFKKYATSTQFGHLAREFFARFSKRYLTYYLSRELSNHVGGEKARFRNIDSHSEFLSALDHHCQQASNIVQEFSGSWLSKTNYVEGKISHDKARDFVFIALKKLRAEFSKRGEVK